MSVRYLKDVAERAFWTYVQSFLGLVLVGGATDWSTVESALYAAIPAALAVFKGAIARFYGDSETAAMMKEK